MAAASFFQSSFHGGEWSPSYQGRADDEFYRKALNVCLNAIPIEEGAWQRRAGTRVVSSTRNGLPAKLLQFAFQNSQPYLMEMTDGHLRFNNGQSVLLDASPAVITAVSSASPAVITTKQAHGWSTGDTVMFVAQPGSDPNVLALALVNRQFVVTKIDNNNFSIADAITYQPFDGSTITWVNNPQVVGRVTDIATPYVGGSWTTLRRVQNQNLVMLLNGSYTPYVVTAVPPTGTAGPIFGLSKAVFQDGPYLDPVPTGMQLTFVSGSTFSLSYQTYSSTTAYGLGDVVNSSGTNYQSLSAQNTGNTPASSPSFWQAITGFPGVNGGLGFQATDVGRAIRLWQQPAAWAIGTSYTTGQYVTYNNIQYQALAASTGAQPDSSPNSWQVIVSNLQVASWVWGTISAVASATQFTIYLANPLINTLPVNLWRLGVYSDTTGYPTGGCFHQGRFWLFGAQPNRIDACCSNAFPAAGAQGAAAAFNFAPTALDGTVSDNNGLSFVFESDEADNIVWAIPDHVGIVIGTAGGEWSLSASSIVNPITPTSVDAHKVTKFKAANVEVVRTGQTVCFVQLHQRKLMEYFAGLYSSKYAGTQLTKAAKHLTGAGIAEIAYQQETTPVVWARCNDGSLIGCTYRRDSTYDANTAPNFSGWHRHVLGTGRSVISLQAGPSPDGGQLDSLCMVTQDPGNGPCWIETMQRLMDEDVPQASAWQLDGAAVPVVGTYTTGSPDTLNLYGMSLYAGKTVDVQLGGLDLGSYVVSATGSVTIQVATGQAALLTQAFLNSTTNTGTGSSASVLWGAGPPASAVNTTLSYTNTMSEGDVLFTPDYKRRLVWTAIQYTGIGIGACRVRIYDLDTRAELAQWDSGTNHWNYGDGGDTPGTIDLLTGDWCITGGDANGHLSLMRFHYNAAAGTITPVRQSDLQVNAIAKGAWAGTSPTSPVIPIQVGNFTYQVMPSISSGLPNAAVAVIDPNTGFQIGTTNRIVEKNALLARGPTQTFYTGGVPNTITTYLVAFYKHVLIGNSLAMTALGQITAAQIKSTWLNSDAVGVTGFSYDQTDGNLIGLFSNSTQGQTYLAKINVQGPAAFVQWSISTLYSPGSNDAMTLNNIAAGKLIYVSGSTLYAVDTAAGNVATTATTYSTLNTSFSDDNTGQFYWKPSQNWATNGLNAGQQNLGKNGQPPWSIPVCVGTTFTSQGQILRAINPQEAGAQNGPALAKTRRSQSIGLLLRRTQGMSIGTDFTKLHALDFRSPGGLRYSAGALFSGPMWATLDDNYSFDSMVCWQVTRPWPATVLAVEPFLHTQDR